jgi:hypothetical protein
MVVLRLKLTGWAAARVDLEWVLVMAPVDYFASRPVHFASRKWTGRWGSYREVLCGSANHHGSVAFEAYWLGCCSRRLAVGA